MKIRVDDFPFSIPHLNFSFKSLSLYLDILSFDIILTLFLCLLIPKKLQKKIVIIVIRKSKTRIPIKLFSDRQTQGNISYIWLNHCYFKWLNSSPAFNSSIFCSVGLSKKHCKSCRDNLIFEPLRLMNSSIRLENRRFQVILDDDLQCQLARRAGFAILRIINPLHHFIAVI